MFPGVNPTEERNVSVYGLHGRFPVSGFPSESLLRGIFMHTGTRRKSSIPQSRAEEICRLAANPLPISASFYKEVKKWQRLN